MTNWIDLTNFAVASGGLMLTVLGFILSLSVSFLNPYDRRFFALLFALLIAYVGADLLSQVSLELLGPGFAELSRVAIFAESLFSSLLMPLLTLYLLRCAGENWRRSPLMTASAALWLAYFAMLVSHGGAFYCVTADNVYRRGAWYPMLLAPPALLMLLNLAGLYRRRKALSRRQRLAFSLYILIPFGCMLVQMATYGLLMIVVGTSVAALCMFMFILRDQMELTIAREKENARQRASIMVLQMRPHFIYNVMTSIYYLCGQDAQKAQSVILDFTSYLRQNFTAISREDTIPFSEEMEHTRAYLAVEKARYEDLLFIEYDTPFTAFRLPPLTLQPIVENAVKHGISPELEPLHLSVSTRRTRDGVEIAVEDSGPGFTPTDDDEPHIALANIRERLRMMCGGQLEIAPGKSGGTKVTVRVPQ